MLNYSDYNDKDLILLLRAGDGHVVDFLLEKYRFLVRRRANALFLIGGDSEDLNQEGMIGLYQAIRDYDPAQGAAFCTFADLCIRRQMYKAIEADGRKRNAPLNGAVSLEDAEPIPTGAGNPEVRYIEEEERRQAEEHYAKLLSPYERRVLHLYLDGYRYTEIACLLGKSPKSADNAIQRIRAKVMQEREKTAVQNIDNSESL